MPSRSRILGALAVWLWLSAWGLAPPAAGQTSEDEVKAALIYNFTRFVDWPVGALPRRDGAFVFCVLGDPGFGTEVAAVVEGKRRDGRQIEMRQLSELSELPACHLLFVGHSERARLPEILAALRQLPVLTVGDSDEFVGSGGMIGLVLRRNRVRFEIDHSAIERAGLAISSRLLGLAERVLPSDRVAGRR